MIAIDLLELARQESEQKRLAAQIVAECAGQMDEFLTLIDGALTAAGDGSLDTEPQTVSEATDSVFGTLLNPAWYCEMLARAAEHADWLDWQQTRESDYPR